MSTTLSPHPTTWAIHLDQLCHCIIYRPSSVSNSNKLINTQSKCKFALSTEYTSDLVSNQKSSATLWHTTVRNLQRINEALQIESCKQLTLDSHLPQTSCPPQNIYFICSAWEDKQVLETVLIHGHTHRVLMDRIPDQPKSVHRKKNLLYKVLMTKQNYVSEFVKRYHIVVRCVFNMDGLISNHYRKSCQ